MNELQKKAKELTSLADEMVRRAEQPIMEWLAEENQDLPSADYPLGGMLEPYDIKNDR